MKKVLVIHNNYRNIGGEDVAVENEIKILKKFFQVETLFFNNKNKNTLNDIFSLIIRNNRNSNKKVEEIIFDFKPDIVYVHNTWFKATLGIFKILNKNNINTTIKLHNFRYSCTRNYFASGHFGKDDICNACGLNKKSLGLFNKYFLDSYFKSLAMIIYGKKYFKILKSNHNKIFVLTDFHKNYLIKLGVEKEKITTFPNYLDFKPNVNDSNNIFSDYVIYAGRISEEKGVYELIKSFLEVNVPNLKLKIIGNGPNLNKLRQIFKEHSNQIEFVGEKPNSEVLKMIKHSRAVLTATKLFEGQPTLLCEASSFGVPSIFPNTGGINEFFPQDYELSFRQFDYEDLKKKLNLLNNLEELKVIGNDNKNYLEEYLDIKKFKNTFEQIHDV